MFRRLCLPPSSGTNMMLNTRTICESLNAISIFPNSNRPSTHYCAGLQRKPHSLHSIYVTGTNRLLSSRGNILEAFTQEVVASSFSLDICYPDSRLSFNPLALLSNYRDSTSIRQLPLPFKSFPSHRLYSTIPQYVVESS
jgi:hypothetical protein